MREEEQKREGKKRERETGCCRRHTMNLPAGPETHPGRKCDGF